MLIINISSAVNLLKIQAVVYIKIKRKYLYETLFKQKIALEHNLVLSLIYSFLRNKITTIINIKFRKVENNNKIADSS